MADKKNAERKANKHIIIDELAFEKLTGLRNLIKAYTQKRLTNSVLIELLVELATDRIIQKIEAEGDKAIFELGRMIDELSAKRGKKAVKKQEINIEEIVKELKKIKEE